MQPEPRIEGLVPKSESGLAVPAHLSLPFDIKTGTMTMYLLTEDRLEAVQSGGDSLDSAFFGASLAVLLFVAGILISAKVANSPINDWLRIPLWTAMFPSIALSLYFGIKDYKCRKISRKRLADIKEKSATVVAIQPQVK